MVGGPPGLCPAEPLGLAVRGASPSLHRERRCARLARRDDREYREYLREEQRRQAGCSAARMQMELQHGLVTKLRLKPPSNGERSLRESSLLGGRCAAAKTASKASEAKTCFISPEHGFRRCLEAAQHRLQPSALGA